MSSPRPPLIELAIVPISSGRASLSLLDPDGGSDVDDEDEDEVVAAFDALDDTDGGAESRL